MSVLQYNKYIVPNIYFFDVSTPNIKCIFIIYIFYIYNPMLIVLIAFFILLALQEQSKKQGSLSMASLHEWSGSG